jgi:hypothetical protein
LVRQEGGAINLQIAEAIVDGRTVATLTFVGADLLGGSLPDGHYTLTLHGDLVHDASGEALPADSVTSFFRLFGDGHIVWDDLRSFRQAMGQQSGNPGYLWYFDYDGDGQVDCGDWLQVLRRFG